MQSDWPQSRWNFIDPEYADIPRIIYWLLNTAGVIGLAAPYLTVLVPCFAVVWGAVELQSLTGMAAYGAVSALILMISTGVTTCAIKMLFAMYCIRHEWEEVVRSIIHEACEECIRPWLR
jgi:hypothetical protein